MCFIAVIMHSDELDSDLGTFLQLLQIKTAILCTNYESKTLHSFSGTSFVRLQSMNEIDHCVIRKVSAFPHIVLILLIDCKLHKSVQD